MYWWPYVTLHLPGTLPEIDKFAFCYCELLWDYQDYKEHMKSRNKKGQFRFFHFFMILSICYGSLWMLGLFYKVCHFQKVQYHCCSWKNVDFTRFWKYGIEIGKHWTTTFLLYLIFYSFLTDKKSPNILPMLLFDISKKLKELFL